MIVVFDIDGTLSDASHRLHWIESKPKNWNAFFKGIPDDSVIWPIVTILKFLAKPVNNTIVLATARPEKTRQMTEQWLMKHQMGSSYNWLFMRPEGNYRPDYIVKSEMVDDISKTVGFPDIWFDDKEKVVAELRNKGIYTVHVG